MEERNGYRCIEASTIGEIVAYAISAQGYGQDHSFHARYVTLMSSKCRQSVDIFVDFGMRIVKRTDDKIWLGGYGDDQYVYVVEKGTEDKFLGGVYLVESEAELEKYSSLSNSLEYCTNSINH